MVLVGTGKDDDLLASAHALGDAEQPDEPVDSGRRAGAGEDDAAVLIGPDDASDRPAGSLAQPRAEGAAIRGFRMAVGIIGKDTLEHEALDLTKRAARGNIIGIEYPPRTEWTLDESILADQPVAQMVGQIARSQSLDEFIEQCVHVFPVCRPRIRKASRQRTITRLAAKMFTEMIAALREIRSSDRMKDKKIDQFDARILRELQLNSDISQRELAAKVGLSQNACWRRLKLLEDSGIIQGRTVRLDRNQLGLGLVVFAMIRTRHHSTAWLKTFRTHVSSIPDIVDFYRIGGDYDYLLKIVTRDMNSYDAVYQKLIEAVELESVTSYFAMEALEEQRPLALTGATR